MVSSESALFLREYRVRSSSLIATHNSQIPYEQSTRMLQASKYKQFGPQSNRQTLLSGPRQTGHAKVAKDLGANKLTLVEEWGCFDEVHLRLVPRVLQKTQWVSFQEFHQSRVAKPEESQLGDEDGIMLRGGP